MRQLSYSKYYFNRFIFRKVHSISSSNSDDNPPTQTLSEDERSAIQHLQMGIIFSEYELLQKYKKMVQQHPQNLEKLSKSMFVLLKQRLGTQSKLSLKSPHENLYREMICNAVYFEDQGMVLLKLCHYDSLTHAKFYNAVQKVFKMKGSREMKTEFKLTINGIKFPYSKNKQDFPPVEISGQSKSKTVLELSVKGLSAMIFVSFFLKPILNQFVKNAGSLKPDLLMDDDDTHQLLPKKHTSNIGTCNLVTIEDEERLSEMGNKKPEYLNPEKPLDIKSKTTTGIKENMQDVGNLNTIEDTTKIESRKPTTNIGASNLVTIGDETGTEKKLHKAGDKKFLAFTKDDVQNVQEIKSKKATDVKEISNPCYHCAIMHLVENVENLLHEERIEIDLSCIAKCGQNSLEILVRSICFLVVSQSVNYNRIQNLIKNVEYVVAALLDHTEYSRAMFYCILFETLDDIDGNKQPMIVTLSRELCELLIESDPQMFFETLKENRQVRRNMLRFISETGHYFALQALVESWTIMHKNGIDIRSVLPRPVSGSSAVQMITSGQESSTNFYFFARITRELITEISKEENILIMEARKIEFRHEGETIDKQGDRYLYINKVDEIMYQVHIEDMAVTLEQLEFSELKYSEKENLLFSNNWNFFLPSMANQEIMFLCNEVFKASNKPKSDQGGMIRDSETFGIGNKMSKDCQTVISPETCKPSKSLKSASPEKNQPSTISRNPIDQKRKHQDEDDDASNSAKESDHNEEHDYCEEETTIETNLVVPREDVMKYWNDQAKNFVRHLVGEDWPQMYGSPCAVIFSYCHTKKPKSAKRLNHFSKMVGCCKICNAKHTCMIIKSPFDESVDDKGVITYKSNTDLIIDVTVTGFFEIDANNVPDIRKPKHDINKATGLFLKGKQREKIGEKVSREGVQNVYMEQFDKVHEHQIMFGNKTSVKSYDVLTTARQEFERKQHCGNDFFESIQNVFDSQKGDVSLNFDETTASKQLPGFLRSVQQTPLKVVMANFDQLRIGANYLNKNENSTIFIDSSGKFLKQEKGKSKILNTAVVIPPPAAGHAPFPIFEMISERNKTIDFQTFLEYGWSYLSTSINNEKVNPPKVAVSDFSFPNIHAILAVFNQVKINEYLETVYQYSVKSLESPYKTVLTICENHTLPNLLLYARNIQTDKAVADTLVAGFLKVLEADTLGRATQVFEDLARVHCLKGISKEARESIKEMQFQDVGDNLCDYAGDFEDEASEEDDKKFGSRRSLRENSPYYKLFKRIIDKVIENEQETNITNRFYAPKLMIAMTKQYLSLFPLFSASSIPNKKLTTNSQIELYWKEQRRILKDIPNRQRYVIIIKQARDKLCQAQRLVELTKLNKLAK